MLKKLSVISLFFALFCTVSGDAFAGSCPLATEAYKAPKDAKFISLQVRMPDGEVVEVNSKSNSFISLSHKETGESYTFKVNTRATQISVELFSVSKDMGRPVLKEILRPKHQGQSTPESQDSMLVSAGGLQFNVLSVSDSRPELPKAEFSPAAECCIRCGGGWSVCCCCCCACGMCCHPQ